MGRAGGGLTGVPGMWLYAKPLERLSLTPETLVLLGLLVLVELLLLDEFKS